MPAEVRGMTARALTLFLADEAATAELGRRLALAARPGDVIALHGDLGAGKTALARGFIRALTTAEEEVPSPTFTLVQTYPAPGFEIWHFDLYRLQDAREVRELGWDQAEAGVILVEWPERLGARLPLRRLEAQLSFSEAGSGAGRIARLVDHDDWSARMGGEWGDWDGQHVERR